MRMTPEERKALLAAAEALESQARNLRFIDDADISEEAANAIVSHLRVSLAESLENLSTAWAFDTMRVCFVLD